MKKGLTLLELLVCVIILSLIVTGLTSAFIAGKRFIIHSRSRVGAVEMGRVFLDYLQMHVREDTWDGAGANDLSIGTRYCDSDGWHEQQLGCPSATDRTINNVTYSANYTIAEAPTAPEVRKVRLRINWNETVFQ